MRLLQFLPVIAAAAALASASYAQQPFGSWIHDNGPTPPQSQLAVYVKPGSPVTNTGLLPTSPLPTLDAAVTLADKLLSIHWPTVGKGVTINVFPGQYFLTQPLSVPVYGFAIEPYKDITQPTGVVDIQLNTSFANGATIQFDVHLGPQCIAKGLSTNGMPPSILRGLDVKCALNGAAVLIDPSQSAPPDWNGPVAVEINQCKLSLGIAGIQIRNLGLREIVYACQIVDNEITSCNIGAVSFGEHDESHLFRSNRIHACFTGIRLSTTVGKAGHVWSRILSNAIWDIRPDPLSVVPQFGLALQGGSAHVVNNTIAYVTGSSTVPVNTGTIRYDNGAIPNGAGETLVIANNVLWSPAFTVPFTTTVVDPAELALPASFAGTTTIVSNDFHSTNPVPFAGSATNTAITDPRFWNMGTPYDVHLTPPSPSASVSNQGNPTFVLPGAPTTIVTPAGLTFLANCALDMDLDARTNQSMVSFTPVLNRGADQLTWDGIRLSAPLSGTALPQHCADKFGALVPDPTGATQVVLQVSGPTGSTYATFLCSTLPMGPELQHVNALPFGSTAIDPAPANSVLVDFGSIGSSGSTQSLVNLGTISPTSLEAEMFLQTIVFRPSSGPTSFSNRIRLDIDRN